MITAKTILTAFIFGNSLLICRQAELYAQDTPKEFSTPPQADSIFNKINPEQFSKAVEKRLSKLEDKIISKSEKTSRRLQSQEEKIYRRQLNSKDSLQAKAKLEEIKNRYKALADKIKNPEANITNGNKQYIPYLDTLKTAFKFLDNGNIRDALSKVESLETRMQQAEEIKKFIRERREQLKQQLEQLGLAKQLKQFNKEIYYYAEQIKEYKAIISDPKKIERKALELISENRAFKEFFKKNNMLASMFRMPGADPNDPAYLANLSGLQTRSAVNNLIQQQISAGGPNAMEQFRQNLQKAQAQMQELKDKVLKSGGSSSDDEIPNFKPNTQKTKSFWKRLEIGANIQSQKPNGVVPVTTDLGLSAGYMLNDKSIIGLGASYKLGWGQNIRNIHLSHQGAGLRSFVDFKLKGSLWLSGGYEMNYQTEFNRIVQLQELDNWQQSGLLGLSKIMSGKSKFFKKTKLQLMWDFLSYEQRPRTQPIVFRIGYNF
jgi:hypothetical protein